MLRKIAVAAFAVISLGACNQVADLTSGGTAKINPEILQKIEVSDRQSILFGHYEHLATIHGRTFEACCVFDANRIKLANYIVQLFENSTGKSFDDREMLIGGVDDKIWVFIVPKSLSAAPLAKTYVVELDKNTGLINSFKASAN